MPDFLCPRIRSCYEFQPNSLMCWAAVALTLWRWRHGNRGRGRSFDALFATPDGVIFQQMLGYQAELVGEMGGSNDLSLLPLAELAVRRANPAYATTPSGLPSGMALTLFTSLLGAQPVQFADMGLLPVAEGQTMKDALTTRGPIAIFPTNIGHLKLIVGYWDSEPAEAAGPQLLMFDPEALIHRQASTGNAAVRAGQIAEERILWAHWKRHYLPYLAYGGGWQI